jgi:hypothetical protein
LWDNLKIHLTVLLLGALFLQSPTLLRAQVNLSDVPGANPARPTVSTPATLTPVGYLQFENGGLYATDSSEFKNRLGFNQVSKLTLDQRAALLARIIRETPDRGVLVDEVGAQVLAAVL